MISIILLYLLAIHDFIILNYNNLKMFMIVSKDDYPIFEYNIPHLVKRKDYV